MIFEDPTPTFAMGSGDDRWTAEIDLESFDVIADIAHKTAGLVLSRDKAPMVIARVGKRMRRSGMSSLAAYSGFIASEEGVAERAEMIYALTTNVTSFFRESHHFEYLASHVIPELLARGRNGERIRLWSAGCSTGQEPYSIAMALLDQMQNVSELDIRILATDIDPYVLVEAKRAIYPESSVCSLPQRWRDRFLKKVRSGQESDCVKVVDDVRRLVIFRKLNLIDAWPMRWPFDAIFCRNVVIYFDRLTQMWLWKRFAAVLADRGHLFLGHSERIDATNMAHFRTVGTTVYQLAEGLDRSLLEAR